jgi:flagellar hook-basal body complex protein FliE
MADIRFAQAAGAYSDALKAADRILKQVQDATGAAEAPKAGGASFLDMVGDSLMSATQTGKKSETMAMQAIRGKADLADVVTAVTDAETALNTVVAIRDKVINAYQDILKMPI